ncbi:MAG TPA: hydrogen peroxide-inducible genes activator [Cellvibrionaceae bacterium]
MTLTEFRYIVSLADERHFGRAAQLCQVSQPTLSIAVKKLEQNLGVILFERTREGLQLTSLGKQVVAKARHVLAQTAEISDLVSAGNDPLNGPLAVGVVPCIGPYLLPQFIPHLQRAAPAMPLCLFEGDNRALAKKLRAGELDVVITTLPFSAADTVVQPLFEEPYQLLLPAGHMLAEKKAIAPLDVKPAEVLLMAEGDAFREQVLAAFTHLAEPVAGEPVRARVQGSTLETLRHMVASGLGVAIVPMGAAQTAFYSPSVMVSRPFTENAPVRQIALAWRASFPRHQAVDALRKAILASSIAYWRYATGTKPAAAGLLVDNTDW